MDMSSVPLRANTGRKKKRGRVNFCHSRETEVAGRGDEDMSFLRRQGKKCGQNYCRDCKRAKISSFKEQHFQTSHD